MLFNSLEYFVFFLVVLALTWLTVRLPRIRLGILVLASYYFYGSNNGKVIFLLFACTLIDFFAGIRIADSADPVRRKRWLIASMIVNLGMLCLFKYFDFFAESFVQLAAAVGVKLNWTDLHLILPVGISFYTFESMSYTIDVYRGHCPAERNYMRFSFFLTYFPHLIAGPIVRPRDFMPQIDRKPRLSVDQFEWALFQVMQGLFKKIVLADSLARYADAAFDHPGEMGTLGAVLGTYAFAFQIYFDFCGYSDIAIGCSKLMGFDLRENFRRPYAALSITDFWRRWHLSLSTWLRDYLYVSLGGNRMRSQWGIYRNLMITMLLGGLWHGAAWHFVIWGGLQGFLLVVEKHFGWNRERRREEPYRASDAFRLLVTFHLVCLSWIVFRAKSNTLLTDYFAAFLRFDQPGTITIGMVVAVVVIVVGGATQVLQDRVDLERRFLTLPVPVKAVGYGLIACAVAVMGSTDASPFIYFQF